MELNKEMIELEEKERLEEIERLTKWNEARELERIKNQKEADELAIIIKEEMSKKTVNERVTTLEQEQEVIINTLADIVGVQV